MTDKIKQVQGRDSLEEVHFPSAINDSNDDPTMASDFVFVMLMTTIKTALDLSITRAKSEELNAKLQNGISIDMSKIELKNVPKEGYEKYNIYKHHDAEWNTDEEGHPYISKPAWDEVIGTGTRVKMEFIGILSANEQQMALRQNNQNSISVLQQQSQLDITGADGAAKSSTQAIGAQRGLLDVLLSITLKMAKKR